MRDRLSTKILSNGATRYGVYDETGNLLRYEYIKLEDEPTVEGDLFSKANMLPDSIPALLGLKMANPQVKDALNVLAHVGNLHVWERVRTYADPVPEVPAGYTLGEVVTGKFQVASYNSNNSDSARGCAVYYVWDDLTLTYDGEPDLSAATEKTVYGGGDYYTSVLLGKFILLKEIRGYNCTVSVPLNGNEVLFIPSDAVLTHSANDYESGDDNMYRTWVDRYQPVSTYPYTPAIPAGTHVDYLTSTDRNTYPDESTNGSDAYYTLGAAGYLNFYYSEYDGSVTWNYSSSISVGVDGTVSLVSPSSTKMMADNTGVSAANNLKGKFVLLSAASDYTDATHGVIYYIPADATISDQVSSTTPWYIQTNKAQPVTGHAAIPANTTITYLGCLGEKTQMAHVYYIGTGIATSESNPLSLTFPFPPKIVLYVGRYEAGKTTNSSTNQYFYPTSSSYTKESCHILMDVLTSSYKNNLGFGYYSSSYPLAKKSNDGKTVYWYAISTNDIPGNDSGVRYDYIAIG